MTLNVQTFNRQTLQSAVFKEIFSENYNFEQGKIPAGSQCNGSALFDIGTVVGQITRGAVAVGTVTFSGTGNGVLTKATPAYAVKAQVGNYLATFIDATTNLGDFEVTRPDGTVDGYGRVGVVYTGDVKFTIADGSADFIAGDQFTLPVTVAAGSAEYVAHDASATDGSQVAAGVIARRVTIDASVDTAAAIAVRGPAVLVQDALIFKSGISASDKAAALAALAAAGLVSRPL